MRNITNIMSDTFVPRMALLFYKNDFRENYYVESMDIADNGKPCNAHPLTLNETESLIGSIAELSNFKNRFLLSEGLLPDNVLYLNALKGCVIWYTSASERQLYFLNELGIEDGKAIVPAMVWKAYKDSLYVYALKQNHKPDVRTHLFYAPFFNIYKNGKVCMGTVEIDEEPKSLEQFIKDWEDYFFNSYFAHLLDGYNPIKDNLVQIWQKLVGANQPFPKTQLKKNNRTIEDLID